MREKIYIGNQEIKLNNQPVKGEYVKLQGELFYKISNYDKMTPFFMTIVSNDDHWMFVSSNGGLTAGRKDPDNSLFPYYNDDVIHSCQETTGNKSIFHVTKNSSKYIWEPFSNFYKYSYNIQRNLYKNVLGNKIIFEEVNYDLGLKFSYGWLNSELFGFIKKSELINNNNEDVQVNILDGIQNILPYGVYQKFQNEFSTLVDGYRKNELVPEVGVGIYSLSSIPVDKAEPSESLKASVVWSVGLSIDKFLLSSRQLNEFRMGRNIESEIDIKAAKGAYFINSNLKLKAESGINWFIVADINYDLSELTKLISLIKKNKNLEQQVLNDINLGSRNLKKIVAAADGIQISNDKLVTSRHFANVLFNIMRGGIFSDSYQFDRNDFISFLNKTNKNILLKYKSFIEELPSKLSFADLFEETQKLSDSEFQKLVREYLPLSFSRRHGDPSRPWNRFSIEKKNSDKDNLFNYEGNWRDIFQNWEALALSFPFFLESMLSKFLNATTADGYNPYRVTKYGFDWEVPEPDMPWSNIGYWGDHQIIYLLKLLELSSNYNPLKLLDLMGDDIFAYANVPYRINSYEELLKDPKNTIKFDAKTHNEIILEEKKIGTDARFITKKDKSIYQVNLFEKLLIILLSKLTNFIPGGGIWMNTQRPEWNDANNALVGNGVSMVTLYYIHRYLRYCITLFSKIESLKFLVSQEVYVLFNEIYEVFETHRHILLRDFTDKERKNILDKLGLAGSKYRSKIYKDGFSSSRNELSINETLKFLQITKNYIDNTIKVNKRDDGLYHSYNLMSVTKEEIKISHLYVMLEGQVAILSSGFLSADESIILLKALRDSKLYREDQNSYMLYPDRKLPLFIEKNIIPNEVISHSPTLKKIVEYNDSILRIDINGDAHFDGEIRNSNILEKKLLKLKKESIINLDDKDIAEVLNIYESVFNHKAFTGRSGTFYKYEGLGCIYWHMVSKLALAVQETFFNAQSMGTGKSDLNEIRQFYYDVKAGIGVHKSPDNFGAFPTDPYSHTPIFSGVQQPGLTGQVKEDIISRLGELGVCVKNGIISFNVSLINKDEFLSDNELFTFYDVSGEETEISISKNSLAFTYCQVPIVYTLAPENSIIITKNSDEQFNIAGLTLDESLSKSIFNREGKVKRIDVLIRL